MPELIMRIVIPALWGAWLLYWIFAARDVKTTRWSESPMSRAVHLVPFLLAAILLSGPLPMIPALNRRFLPDQALFYPLGAALVAAGLGYAAWARRHLGRNWSAMVTLKEGHSLVRTGPYRRLRHPIYTGVLLGFFGTAVAVGEWRGLLAVAFALAAFVRKIGTEEGRMRETFPEYDQYRAESAALVPFVF